MCSFFLCRQRWKVQDSIRCVQWRAHESHPPPPPASSQSVRVSCVQWRAHESHAPPPPPPPCEQSVSESQLCAVKSARVTRPCFVCFISHPTREKLRWTTVHCLCLCTVWTDSIAQLQLEQERKAAYLCASNVTPTAVLVLVSVFLYLLCFCRMSSAQMTRSRNFVHFWKNWPVADCTL